MSEGKKLLIGFAVVGGICCCMAVAAFFVLRQFGQQVDNMVIRDPTAVAQAQEKIADFDIPPGYQSMAMAMSMFIYDIITLAPSNSNHPMILLMQYNGMMSGNPEQIEQQLREAAEQQSPQAGVSMQVVNTFDIVIRNETSTITVSEGRNSGIVFRQWVTVFEGNGGPVIFMAQGDSEGWDEQLLMDFLASIR